MKKRDWITVVLIPFALTWLIDRVTKLWATDLSGIIVKGPIGFTLHHNPGAILGLFSDLPPVLRIVSLSTGGAFLILTFLIIQILLPVRARVLRFGMSVLLGGIIGNVSDRIYWGYVVDFVVFTFFKSSPVFNLADALQWVGYAMVVFALIRDGKAIWPENNLRKTYWVDTKYQLRYCMKLVAFGFGFSTIAGIYSYTFLKVALESAVRQGPSLDISSILTPFTITFIIVCIVFVAILFFTGLVLSNRAAGPVYAFQRFIEGLLNGEHRPLKLRSGDEFMHLEEVAEKLAKEVLKKDSDLADRKEPPTSA
jgi:signal peptidase II